MVWLLLLKVQIEYIYRGPTEWQSGQTNVFSHLCLSVFTWSGVFVQGSGPRPGPTPASPHQKVAWSYDAFTPAIY